MSTPNSLAPLWYSTSRIQASSIPGILRSAVMASAYPYGMFGKSLPK
ncbi:Uncharacterised protein [Mycobacteroides abscessus subsp. abscessus]|nr:Uncharacterised protein [Mycobacteroides abscessus subsp. abscessus]